MCWDHPGHAPGRGCVGGDLPVSLSPKAHKLGRIGPKQGDILRWKVAQGGHLLGWQAGMLKDGIPSCQQGAEAELCKILRH